MMHKQMSRLVGAAILWLLLPLFSCKTAHNHTGIETQSLPGSFIAYQSAMGKGNGLLFHISLPKQFSNNHTIDSFIVGGKSVPFTIRNTETGVMLEADYYVSLPGESLQTNGKPDKPATHRADEDPILKYHRFYPSWISFSHATEKLRWNITDYKEDKQEKKY